LIAAPIPELNADTRPRVPVAFVVFGGGKLLAALNDVVKNAQFQRICFRMLPAYTDVYSQILSCADLGIAFDVSRSGFDAATELTEMVACEIPVLAFKFGCVSEFITHEKTGLLFGNFEELLALLKRVLDPQSDALAELRKNCARKPPDWDAQWETAFADLVGSA
jgi:glycosyltransferase involved in cell wall biosynthesis